MCAAFEWRGRGYKPGRELDAVGPEGVLRQVWSGFSRSEILDWWLQRGGVLLDIPADRFAERSRLTGKLVWAEVPRGLVLRGLLDPNSGRALLKIVTRASSPEEQEHFHHPRMPVLASPIFPSPAWSEEEEEDRGLLF